MDKFPPIFLQNFLVCGIYNARLGPETLEESFPLKYPIGLSGTKRVFQEMVNEKLVIQSQQLAAGFRPVRSTSEVTLAWRCWILLINRNRRSKKLMMSIYWSRSFPRSNLSFLLCSGNASQSSVLRLHLREEMYVATQVLILWQEALHACSHEVTCDEQLLHFLSKLK